MGRPRKWDPDYETFVTIKTGTKEESDKALRYLYEKYENAFWKQKHKMDSVMKASNIYGLDNEDYLGETYDTFLKAVDSIKLEKIPASKQKTWCFYAQLNGYLMSHNRDQINHHIKNVLSKEVPLSGYNTNDDMTEGSAQDYLLYHNASSQLEKSPEETYFEEREKKAFWKAVEVSRKTYSPLENKIWDLRDSGKTKREICETTHIEMKDLNKSLRSMKTTLMGNIETYKAKYLH